MAEESVSKENSLSFKTHKMKLLLVALLISIVSFSHAFTEQYCLTFRDDPSSTIVIGWGGDNGSVHYGEVDEGGNYTAYPNTHPSDRTGNAHGHSRHFARLSGLTPNTMYYFVIRDVNGVVTDRYKFKTLSDDPNQPVSFITGGDSRDGFKVLGVYVEDCPSGDCLEIRRQGNRLVAKLRPDFVAFNGDFVMNQITSNTENEWDQWFDDWQETISTDGRMYPMTHTLGNHEDNDDNYNLFDIPQDEYYALNFHNGLLRMYMLNTEMDACNDVDQLNWLINDLQIHSSGNGNDPYWKFAQYHIPTFGMANNYGLVQEQMTCWVNLFEQSDVRLVSESHGHCTKWSYPAVANASETDFEVDMENGVVYIGEGQWGAPHRELDYAGANQKPYIRDQGVFDNFFFIRVTKDTTTIQCVRFDGEGNVQASTNDDLGKELPADVSVWNPSNGPVLYLTNDIDVSNLEESSKLNPSTVFPNPTENVVFLKIDPAKEGTIELYNSLGKACVIKDFQGTEQVQVDMSQICSGVSYLHVRYSDGTVESHRVVKR